MVYIIDPVCR